MKKQTRTDFAAARLLAAGDSPFIRKTASRLAATMLTALVWSASAQEKVDLPGVKVLGAEKKFIEAEGAVALTNGILEFAAVETGGRDYESVLALKCKPSALQFTLLLIGCEPGALPSMAKDKQKVGDRLDIEVEWEAGGKAKRAPLEELLIHRKTKKPAAGLKWIFTGSSFGKDLEGREIFMADVEQAHVALWWNASVLINVDGDFGNPYQGEETGFDINDKLIPPEKTPIKLILRKHEGK